MQATGTRWETARVEAFSDGVFAIAITLLVLEIGVDPADFDHLWQALADEWPSYLAYVTSFLTVGGVWLAHHRLFSHLRYVDPMLMRLNILLLMVASFLPFPTGLLAEAFDVDKALHAKTTTGSTHPDAVAHLLAAHQTDYAEHARWWEDRREHVRAALSTIDTQLGLA